MNDSTGSVSATDRIRTAQALYKQDRQQGLAALNELFRAGHPPQPPLDGPYHGELVAVEIAPGVTQFVEGLARLWMPWKGKYVMAANSQGDNIFGRGNRLIFRVLFPFYRSYIEYEPEAFRAFLFQTSITAGQVDPDRSVFKIDYDSPANPTLTIRPLIDELVQVDEGIYLGKVHFKWWWGRRQMIGYFALRARADRA
ncbi:MAG: hypothetical protein ACREYF_14555 [Gammaproteobacteria bacterium]